jgi:hypothetical protein
MGKFNIGVQVGKIFEFIKLTIFFKALRGSTPSGQIVRTLLIPPGWQCQPEKRSENSSNGFDKLKNSTN